MYEDQVAVNPTESPEQIVVDEGVSVGSVVKSSLTTSVTGFEDDEHPPLVTFALQTNVPAPCVKVYDEYVERVSLQVLPPLFDLNQTIEPVEPDNTNVTLLEPTHAGLAEEIVAVPAIGVGLTVKLDAAVTLGVQAPLELKTRTKILKVATEVGVNVTGNGEAEPVPTVDHEVPPSVDN